jgi:hypothetical protein
MANTEVSGRGTARNEVGCVQINVYPSTSTSVTSTQLTRQPTWPLDVQQTRDDSRLALFQTRNQRTQALSQGPQLLQ